MTPTFAVRYLLLVAVVVAGIGTVDAALDEQWDLLAVFAILDVVLATLTVRASGRRPAVPLRADLVRWLRRRAATTGESLDAVADRAVATYRDRMDPSLGRPGGETGDGGR